MKENAEAAGLGILRVSISPSFQVPTSAGRRTSSRSSPRRTSFQVCHWPVAVVDEWASCASTSYVDALPSAFSPKNSEAIAERQQCSNYSPPLMVGGLCHARDDLRDQFVT